MRVEDFIEATNAASTTSEVFACFQSVVERLGFKHIKYVRLSTRGDDDRPRPALESTYPAEWNARYIEKSYMSIDPIRRFGLISHAAFRWDDLRRSRPLRPLLSDAERRLLDEGREAGLRNGIGIPLHGPDGVDGIGLASPDDRVDLPPNALSLLTLVGIQFHHAYQAKRVAKAADPVRLTQRERDVLSWCARGKSTWSIGEILGISGHGVDFHIRNILKKLDADCRMTAVVKAMRQHLIEP